MPEVYVSVDIEADGPIPGVNSMLSLGAAAFRRGSVVPVATFEVNLAPLEGAGQHPDTMAWWARFPEAWAHVTHEPREPAEAMAEFAAWTRALPGKPVMVVYPSWDFMWVHWYLQRFTGGSPYGIGALDLKSMLFANGQVSESFRGTAKRRMPRRWFRGAPKHTHKALDDAIGQGVLFVRALQEIRGAQNGPG